MTERHPNLKVSKGACRWRWHVISDELKLECTNQKQKKGKLKRCKISLPNRDKVDAICRELLLSSDGVIRQRPLLHYHLAQIADSFPDCRKFSLFPLYSIGHHFVHLSKTCFERWGLQHLWEPVAAEALRKKTLRKDGIEVAMVTTDGTRWNTTFFLPKEENDGHEHKEEKDGLRMTTTTSSKSQRRLTDLEPEEVRKILETEDWECFDPGRKMLYVGSKGSKLSSGAWRNAIGINDFHHVLKLRKKGQELLWNRRHKVVPKQLIPESGIQESEAALSQATLKVGSVEVFISHLAVHMAHWEKMWAFYGDVWFDKKRFQLAVKRHRATSEAVNAILGKQQQKTAFFGDASCGNVGKGLPPTPATGLRKACQEKLISLDEFRTSKMCHVCEGELMQSKDKDKKLAWSVKHCKKCGKTWNRDDNAAANMEKIVKFYGLNGTRPIYLSQNKVDGSDALEKDIENLLESECSEESTGSVTITVDLAGSVANKKRKRKKQKFNEPHLQHRGTPPLGGSRSAQCRLETFFSVAV